MHDNEILRAAMQKHEKEFNLSVDQVVKTIILVLDDYIKLGGQLDDGNSGEVQALILQRMRISMMDYNMQFEHLLSEES